MSENFEKSKPEVATGINLPLAVQESADLVNSSRRRHLARFAMGTPVLMTLASRPVLAGQCLSNMMSGNLSDPNRGSCAKGKSPGGWGLPGGTLLIYDSTPAAWTALNLIYGVYSSSCGHPNQLNCYSGGSTFGNQTIVPGVLNKENVPLTLPLRELLANENNASYNTTRHLVAAYLNALVSAKNVGFTYVLTTAQVKDLATGATQYPPAPANVTNWDLNKFLDSTWT